MNRLNNIISLNNDKIRYDESVKKLLSLKVMLAYILNNTLEEFKDRTIEETMKCIERVGISERNVDEDEMIKGINIESVSVSEGIRKFDILFDLIIRVDGRYEKIIVNIEAQNTSTSYSLLKRAQYYVSRMISNQYGREFVKSEYDNLKKVVSIWLCMKNGCEKGKMDIYYNHHKNSQLMSHQYKDTEDFFTIVMVDIGKSDNPFINTLNILFSDDDARKKIEVLKKELGNVLKEEEVKEMCNFSEAVYERGRTKGKEEGVEIGKEEGIKIGKEEGIEIGKEEGIKIGKEEGKFERNIVSLKLLMNRFKLSFLEAMKALNINECDYDMYKKELNCL